MYITQLRGVLEGISQNNEEILEEAGRRLAQSLAAEGTIYVHGLGGARFLADEAIDSDNRLPGSQPLMTEENQCKKLTERDALLLFIPPEQEEKAQELVQHVQQGHPQLIGISMAAETGHLDSLFDTHLVLPNSGPLVPFSDDRKIGQPQSFSFLFIYHLIYFSLLDILEDQGLLDDSFNM